MTIVASLRGVSKKYGATVALRPTDLDLRTGVTGLLGPNGAGKSTLIRLLATAQPPTTGTISVAGHDVTGSVAERTEARRRLGYLPQEVGLPRRSTAFDFLDYLAVLKEWTDTAARHAEVLRVLDLVELGSLGGKRVSALSGGQRRRLSIAQALMGDPTLVVLDEPTTGLDPEQRASLRGCCRSRPAPAAYCSPPTRPRTSRRSATASSSSTAAPSASTAPSRSSSPPPPARCGSPPRRTRERSAPGGPDRARCARSEELPGPTPSSSSRRWRTRISSCAQPPDPMKEPSHDPARVTRSLRRRTPGSARRSPRSPGTRSWPTSSTRCSSSASRSPIVPVNFVDDDSSSLSYPIVPATCFGIFGLLVMAGLVRRSDQAQAAAGTVVLSERERTYALASAAVVPFTVGLAFFAWAVWQYHAHPPRDYTIPFGDVGDGWVYAMLFALGTLCTLGGPILGLVVGRWLQFRGAAILVSVALVLLTISSRAWSSRSAPSASSGPGPTSVVPTASTATRSGG